MTLPKDPAKREVYLREIGDGHRGITLSENHRRKIGTSLKQFNNLNKRSEEWCRNISGGQRGRHLSEETRRKISMANTGKKRSIESRLNQSNSTRGRIFSKDHCRKIGEAVCGSNHGMWRGGISFEPYCHMFNLPFKRRVRAFFGYKCVECEMTQEENGRLLDVHHVNYDKMVCCNDVKPLFVALYRSHNTMANYNREYWEEHYTTIINEKYGGSCYLPKGVE